MHPKEKVTVTVKTIVIGLHQTGDHKHEHASKGMTQVSKNPKFNHCQLTLLNPLTDSI